MTLSPVLIVCAKEPLHVATVPAVRLLDTHFAGWYCSRCGARVKVVA